jgi:hypothetical protein
VKIAVRARREAEDTVRAGPGSVRCWRLHLRWNRQAGEVSQALRAA